MLQKVPQSYNETLNHDASALQMGRRAVGPVCCVKTHLKESSALMEREGDRPVFLV